MRPTAGFGILAVIVCIILFEFASAGALLVNSAQASPSEASPSDPCYGYAICQ
jgi:hypothetical protein